MSFRAIYGFLFFCLISASPSADELQLNPSHPDRYTVVKGDTLWDISGKFLRDPWRWPEIWQQNSQIKNPDLIYPGDVIALTYVDGKPRLSLQRGGLSGSGRLSPRIREQSLEDAIPAIPIHAIKQFLSSSRVVTESEIEKAPYIVAFAGEHLTGGAGQNAYVTPFENGSENLGYTIYRKGIKYKDPETGENLGHEAVYIGDTQLVRGGDPATFHIQKSKDVVLVGDKFLPMLKERIRLSYHPRPPQTNVEGHIIGVLEGVSQIGQYDVVAIDRGLDDGIETGNVLEIFQAGERVRDVVRGYGTSRRSVQLPNERAGVLLVFRPFKRVSYALIMKATGPIHVLDVVKNPES